MLTMHLICSQNVTWTHFLTFQKVSEQTQELLAEKSRIAEEEAQLLTQKMTETEKELMRIQLAVMKVTMETHKFVIFVH